MDKNRLLKLAGLNESLKRTDMFSLKEIVPIAKRIFLQAEELAFDHAEKERMAVTGDAIRKEAETIVNKTLVKEIMNAIQEMIHNEMATKKDEYLQGK